jgi:hypothetical protein
MRRGEGRKALAISSLSDARRSMGSSRFLRAVRARHRHGLVVIKAYIKPDSAVSLRALVRRLRGELEARIIAPAHSSLYWQWSARRSQTCQTS